MTHLAFIFPGQGSQKVGMGAELAKTYLVASEVFDEADEIIGRTISKLCFEGPETELKQTENTQLAILTCSVATLRILTQNGIVPKVVAGHSLGEYSALIAAGVLEFTDTLRLVSARAKYMAEAGGKYNGTMAAILGMPTEQLQNIINQVDGVVEIANFNCPGQLVISGETDAVNNVVALASDEIGARRCRPLQVSGAFHSPLMVSAQEKFKSVIESVTFKPLQTEIVMNVTGENVTDADDIKRLLLQQIIEPVQWEKTQNSIEKQGISNFIEVGPGTVLSGLVKRTLPDCLVMNVEDVKTLKLLIDEYGKGA